MSIVPDSVSDIDSAIKDISDDRTATCDSIIRPGNRIDFFYMAIPVPPEAGKFRESANTVSCDCFTQSFRPTP